MESGDDEVKNEGMSAVDEEGDPQDVESAHPGVADEKSEEEERCQFTNGRYDTDSKQCCPPQEQADENIEDAAGNEETGYT